MLIRMAVGRDSFEKIRQNKDYYIDKTELVYELVEKTSNEVTLFTRPRRFGKTLNMSMMECFFDIKRDSRDLFDGLEIAKHTEFCSEWMNKYPVIFFSLKSVDGLDFDSAYGQLKYVISELYQKFEFLCHENAVDEADVITFKNIMFRTASLFEIKNSLKIIMRMLNVVYGKRVILLIDEYDVPLAKASEKNTFDNKYYERMLDVVRGIFDAALKTNEYLKFAVITGCLKIAKESIFTGTNNFKSYSVLDKLFSQYFGFSDEEVKLLLKNAELSDKFELIRKWYNGYIFGNSSVYCPWDVVNYVADVSKEDIKPQNYWKNTSHNSILLTFVKRTDFDVADKFEILLNGGTITQTISDDLTYDALHESEENLWSVLLMTGYLTKSDINSDGNLVELKIPNEEISNIFEDTVIKFFNETLDKNRQKDLMEALWNGEEEKASKLMTEILFTTISYYDYHENYYHAFLTGIISGLGYAVKSNKENGLGRSDIDIKDKKRRRAMVIETKRTLSKENMEKDCDEAINQIIEKDYLKGFSDFEHVVVYGISFFRKKALIKKYHVNE
ncbi:MAG: AAA family ATPase [Firmicutes bacterium]|nr:AAA family ATPase [Bacillota bacterium]